MPNRPPSEFVVREPSRVLVRTLGCRLNQAESEEIVGALGERGVTTGDTEPDLVVVNTCAVTAEASKASRKLIRRSVAEHPASRVVVTGCYAVAEGDNVRAIPGVDLVVANEDKERLAELVTTDSGSSFVGVATSARIRSNLKIQTGCDELCTFCIVPRTRGGLSSRTDSDVSAAARALVEAGTREIILTGVHLGKYGWDRPGGTLIDIIQDLASIPLLERIRLSSIEASQVDRNLLEVIASEPKVCRHLHMPLQTGNAGVWQTMRRPGTLARFVEIAELAKEIVTDVSLTTDVMVGFPGEDDRAFLETVDVVERLEFRKLHVFRYSPRPGTPAAADARRVDPSVVRRRAAHLRQLDGRLRARWMQASIGRRVRVLIERSSPQSASPGAFRLDGLTDNYLRVHTVGSAETVGRSADVLVTSAGQAAVEGDLVD